MSETKICPNCGKEILAVAKKCKYCGTWIEPKYDFHCPICCEVIPEDSVICPVCHERLRPDPEPEVRETTEPDIEEEARDTVKQSAEPQVLQAPVPAGKPRKKWIIPVIAAAVALCIAAVFLFKPTADDSSYYDDAKALHEWFFENLGTHVKNLSSTPELEARLTKLLGTEVVNGINGLLENSSFNNDPNVGIMHEDDGTGVFTLIGAKNSPTASESFYIKYIDYGECGYLDVATMIGGKYKAGKETLNYTGIRCPVVKTYEYGGQIGLGRRGRDIDITLWVDGPGVCGDKVRGIIEGRGDEGNTVLSGGISNGEDDTHLSLSLEEVYEEDVWFPPQFELELGESMEMTNELKGLYVVNYGHSEDPDDESPQGINYIPVYFKLERTDLDDGNPASKMKYYNGKIYNTEKSKDIRMVLKVSGDGSPGNSVSGYYNYCSQPNKRIFFKNSLIESYHGSDWTLDLKPVKEDECFTLILPYDMRALARIEGWWARVKNGVVDKPDNHLRVVLDDEDGD